MAKYIDVELSHLICCNDQMVYIMEHHEAICVWCGLIKEGIRDIREYYRSEEYQAKDWGYM